MIVTNNLSFFFCNATLTLPRVIKPYRIFFIRGNTFPIDNPLKFDFMLDFYFYSNNPYLDGRGLGEQTMFPLKLENNFVSKDLNIHFQLHS